MAGGRDANIPSRESSWFQETGFPTERVTLKLGYAGDIVDTILMKYGPAAMGPSWSPITDHALGNGIAERLSRDLWRRTPGSCNKLRPLLTTGSSFRHAIWSIAESSFSLPVHPSLCTINPVNRLFVL